MTVPGDPAGYKLAYEAGLRAVEEQALTLRETRDRAGALMSAALVVVGLVAGLAFTSDRVDAIGWTGWCGFIFGGLDSSAWPSPLS